jgi:hypothetical protein
MELSTPWEVISFVLTWKFSSILWNSKIHYRIHNSFLHLLLSWTRPIQSTTPQPIRVRSISILSTHLCPGLPSGLIPSGFHTNNLYMLTFSHLCYMLHSSHLSQLDHSNYTLKIVSIFPITSFLVKIFSSAPCSQTPLVFIPPLMLETECHIIMNHRQNYSLAYSNFYVSWHQTWRQKVLDDNSDDNISPCFRPLWIRKLSEKCRTICFI